MKTIGIIGFGRFGALWASLLPAESEVRVFEPNETVAVPTEHSRATSLAEVCDVDILFLIVPIGSLQDVCAEVSPLVRVDTIVCDAASVKTKPKEWMLSAFGAEQPLVFTHPLFGPDSVARSGVAGKKIVLCTESDSRGMDVLRSIALASKLEILETTAEDHDRQMARSQALVHFIGRGLAPLELTDQRIATPDYERLLAMVSLVKHDTMELFRDMQQYNPYAEEVRKTLLHSLTELESTLE